MTPRETIALAIAKSDGNRRMAKPEPHDEDSVFYLWAAWVLAELRDAGYQVVPWDLLPAAHSAYLTMLDEANGCATCAPRLDPLVDRLATALRIDGQ